MVARTIGSVKPMFAQDRVVDVYWQKIWLEYQKGNLIVTQEDLEYFREAHPIAKALAEGDCSPFDPQIQAMMAAGQGNSSWIDPSEVITPRMHEEIESPISIQRPQPVTESPVSIQRRQPVNESPISIQGRTNEMESPVSIQRTQTTPESQPIVTRVATQEEPETPIAGSLSGPVESNSQEVLYPCSECSTVLTTVTSLRAHQIMKHFHQTMSPPAPVSEDQNEATATGSQETEVVTLSSDDQDFNIGRSPTKRTRITSPGTSGSSRVTRARTRAMQGIVKPESGVPADEAGPSVGSPITRRGGRAPDIRRTLPVRERSGRVADVYWQEIWQEYQKGNLMVSQEDLE